MNDEWQTLMGEDTLEKLGASPHTLGGIESHLTARNTRFTSVFSQAVSG